MKCVTRLLAVLLALSLAAAIGWAGGAKESAGAAAAATGHESQLLAARVQAGTLPPLAQRLPKEPLVIKEGMLLPKEDATLSVGKYGGQLRFASPNPDGGAEFWIQNNVLLRNQPGIGLLTTDVIPWFLKGYTVDTSGKVFTFTLREGVKWSDGVEVTTEDVQFWYDDYLNNKDLTPTIDPWLSPGGVPVKLQVVDRYNFRFSFGQPYGSLLVRLGSYWFGNTGVIMMPKHFLKNYHTKYASLDSLKPKLKEAGLQDDQWALLFQKTNNSGPRGTIGLPVLTPWVLKERPSAGVSIFERNPYYWAVDSQGNQLPYIDTLRNEVVTDSNAVLLKTMTGDLDLIAEAAVGADMPLLKENEQKGNYRVVEVSNFAEIFIFFNYGNKDKPWATIVQNPKFRLALSTALNRKEFVKIVYNNLASVPEWAPAYNPAAANKLLDEIGLNKRDADGWRLRPDGKRMEMNFEFPQVDTGWTKKCELAAEQWKAVGIYSTIKVIEYGLWYTRAQANELYVSTAWGHSYQLCISEPLMSEMLLPFEPRWPPTWWQWYSTHGAMGDKPTMPEALQLYDYFDQLRVAFSNKDRVDITTKIQNLWHDNNLFIIDSEKAIDPWVISAKLGNTPNSGSRHAANASAMVYYYK